LQARLGVRSEESLVSTLGDAMSQMSTTSIAPPDARLTADLVYANRILADQGVLDGFGHVSVRHDGRPDHFLLSRSMAPALVTPGDILIHDLDGSPVGAGDRKPYLERFI